MYSLVKTLGLQVAVQRELIPFAMAITAAELFYKFHSFALECVAFLITWHALSFLQSAVLERRR